MSENCWDRTLARERRQALLGEALAHALTGLDALVQGVVDLFVSPAGVSFEQDTGVGK